MSEPAIFNVGEIAEAGGDFSVVSDCTLLSVVDCVIIGSCSWAKTDPVSRNKIRSLFIINSLFDLWQLSHKRKSLSSSFFLSSRF